MKFLLNKKLIIIFSIFQFVFSIQVFAANNTVLNTSASVAQGAWYSAPAITLGSNITAYNVEITNLSADVDLYVKEGSSPTSSSYDCRPYSSGNSAESCSANTLGNSTLYIKVNGYQAGSFQITVTTTTSTNSAPNDELDDQGADSQYHGGFNPSVGSGGFGGGNCTSTKTPVVFIHGNGDKAINWDNAPTGPYASASGRSVYEEFIHNGYSPCDLFGISYLTAAQIANPAGNYHSSSTYNIIDDFIADVLTYTGKTKVDIVAHSFGSSMALATIKYNSLANKVNKFVNIAGGIRGLSSCLYMGYANPIAATCGSENWFDSFTFGFYPSTGISFAGLNSWTGATGEKSMRRAPEFNSAITFYTITAGSNDGIHCGTLQGINDCSKGALFNGNELNVKAQLDVGAGSNGPALDYDFSLWKIEVAAMGGDIDGVGHFKSRKNTGEIIFKMLSSNCTGLECKGTYSGPVIAKNNFSVAQGAWYTTQVVAPSTASQITIELDELSADVDLYVKKGSSVSSSNYDCRPYNGGTTSESCIINNSGSNTWYIGVYGYQSGSFNLNISFQ